MAKKQKIIIIVAIVSIISIFLLPYAVTLYHYNTGKKYLESEQFELALEEFGYLNDAYKDSLQLKCESKYQIAVRMMENKEYQDALTILTEIQGIKDVSEDINLCNYNLAKDLYDRGHFSDALLYLSEITSGYKDTNVFLKKCETLNSIQGEWKKTDWFINGKGLSDLIRDDLVKGHGYIFKGWIMTGVSTSQISLHTTETYHSITIDDDCRIHADGQKIYFRLVENKLSSYILSNNELFETYIKGEIQTYFDPYIGMTKKDLQSRCSWGKPKDINKTTTAYGVHEQWVYSGNRYIYLDDGIITSIQE